MRIGRDGKPIAPENDWTTKPEVIAKLAPKPGDAAPQGAAVLSVKKLKASGLTLDQMLEQIETAILCEALDIAKGNQTEAAELIGLNRTTFSMRFRSLRSRGINASAYRLKSDLSGS